MFLFQLINCGDLLLKYTLRWCFHSIKILHYYLSAVQTQNWIVQMLYSISDTFPPGLQANSKWLVKQFQSTGLPERIWQGNAVSRQMGDKTTWDYLATVKVVSMIEIVHIQRTGLVLCTFYFVLLFFSFLFSHFNTYFDPSFYFNQYI